jgi:hypothetical protein
MARKDPPGLIYLGSGLEVEAYFADHHQRDVVTIKLRRWTPGGKKKGLVFHVTLDLLHAVPKGAEYPTGGFVDLKRFP